MNQLESYLLKLPPDYENPVDSNTDNIYSITVTWQLNDENVDNSSSQNLKITIKDLDEIKPVITGPSGEAGDSSSSISMDENLSSIGTFTANESVTWSLSSGIDRNKFDMDESTGELSFKTSPDYENPVDSDTDNIYFITVTATDAVDNSSSQNLKITIKDLDEIKPVITGPSGEAGDSSSSISMDENLSSIGTFTANESVSWSLSGGIDRNKFDMDESTGELSFKTLRL